MEMEKKYLYNVGLSAEGNTFGKVRLTKEQAKIVEYVSDYTNWEKVEAEAWSGSFCIDTENPEEIA